MEPGDSYLIYKCIDLRMLISQIFRLFLWVNNVDEHFLEPWKIVCNLFNVKEFSLSAILFFTNDVKKSESEKVNSPDAALSAKGFSPWTTAELIKIIQHPRPAAMLD